ncbi:hypothetical protein [Myxococcus landrumensis]|uniref:Lipoprotein n=1 Tax=Myxococcus landrumensis TaxID=2813577 RepID=A0ABX7NBZ7_9BACT|nr:hypothetical protein [Myxococcus landrumus]QSQ13838.1 hypothetical protein JY572_36860 [Myxococcus landrumus]
MRKILFMLVAIPLLSACGDSDDGKDCGQVEAPATHKGAKRQSCGGDPQMKITCCSYVSETCLYQVCELPTACGKWEENSFSCDAP